MMRSLFSGVSGLKTHQTRMDVIGNNIANVNTTAYKAQNMVFSDLLYQQTQAASGANVDTGRGGINARQIGLGSKTAAINTAITKQGSAQSTNNPWDVMISGESFFIVSSGNGGQNFFTRDGSFTIDGAGNLVMASTGYKVMGWQVDPDTGEIMSGPVAALQVMNAANMTAPAEATTMGIASGILDRNDPDVNSKAGLVRTLQFFDARGYSYTAKFSIHSRGTDGKYNVQLDDILDSDAVSLVDKYNLTNIDQIATFGSMVAPPATTSQFNAVDTVKSYDAATQTFKVIYSNAQMFDGYSENPMLVAAKDEDKSIVGIVGTGNPPVTPIGDGDPINQGNVVRFQGKITLDRGTLTKSPYGLIYNDDASKGLVGYYDKDGQYLDADDKDAAGNVTTSSAAKWEAALKEIKGIVPGTISVSADGDKREISYQVDCTAKTTATYQDKQCLVDLKYDTADPASVNEILEKVYGLVNGADGKEYTISYIAPTGQAQISTADNYKGYDLVFNTNNGKFDYVGSPQQNAVSINFKDSASSLVGDLIDLGHFSDISIDFSTIRNVNNGKTSTVGFDAGDGGENNLGAGRKEGALIGVEVGQDGKIRASYDNGLSKLLGQIAVTKFANAAGLAKAGNNLYRTTMNSGEFDGVGMDITSDGEGSMESGVLEMSNVDLAGEFTEMITTQRGFQANSRIITTSDSMLEELVNLKR